MRFEYRNKALLTISFPVHAFYLLMAICNIFTFFKNRYIYINVGTCVRIHIRAFQFIKINNKRVIYTIMKIGNKI